VIGLWLEGGELSLASNLVRPEPKEDEALIRLRLAGICNTDLEMVRGYYPFTGILGHEFVGVVEQAPSGHEALVGHRVVGEINAVCGNCAACRAGRSNHCMNRTVLGIVRRDGAFAEYLTLPTRNLHVVPDEVPDEVAVFAEPLAAALQIQEQVEIGGSHRVLVVGDGKLGQLIARTLALTGAKLVVAGRHREKLAPLAAAGVDTVHVTGAGPASELTEFDIAVECTGSPAGFETAGQALRPRGTLVMKSTYADRLTIDASRLVVDEITLVGSRCGPFAPALELLASGELRVDDLVAARYPLENGLRALEHARRPGVLKVLLSAR